MTNRLIDPAEVELAPSHVLAFVVELGLLIAVVTWYLIDDPWRWHRDGERFAGVITEIELPADAEDSADWAMLRNPETEKSVRYDPPADARVGDDAEVIVSPEHPSHARTSARVTMYAAWWVALAVAAAIWPVLVWSSPLWVLRIPHRFDWRITWVRSAS